MAIFRERSITFDGGSITIPGRYGDYTFPGSVQPEDVEHPLTVTRKCEPSASIILPGASLLHSQHEVWDASTGQEERRDLLFDGWYKLPLGENEAAIYVGGMGDYYTPTDDNERLEARWRVGDVDTGDVEPRIGWLERFEQHQTPWDEDVEPGEDGLTTGRIGVLTWDMQAVTRPGEETYMFDVAFTLWTSGGPIGRREGWPWLETHEYRDGSTSETVHWDAYEELPPEGEEETDDGTRIISYPWGHPPQWDRFTDSVSSTGRYVIPDRLGELEVYGAVISKVRVCKPDSSLCSNYSWLGGGAGGPRLRCSEDGSLMFGAKAVKDVEAARPFVNYR